MADLENSSDGPQLPPDYYSPDDLPSFDPTRPTHAMGADLTLYWPWVRPCWEEARRG